MSDWENKRFAPYTGTRLNGVWDDWRKEKVISFPVKEDGLFSPPLSHQIAFRMNETQGLETPAKAEYLLAQSMYDESMAERARME